MTQYWSKSSKAEFPYGAQGTYFSLYFVKENNPVGKLGLIQFWIGHFCYIQDRQSWLRALLGLNEQSDVKCAETKDHIIAEKTRNNYTLRTQEARFR